MRVLHAIAGAAVGGAETFCLDMIAALAERGIEQRVLCRPHPRTMARLGDFAVPFEPCSFTPASRLLGGPGSVRRAAARCNADLVHAWMSRAASFVPADMPCPVVGWLGGYYDLKYFKTSDYLVGVTHRIRQHIVEHGVAADRAFVCHTFGTLPDCPPVGRDALGVPAGALLLLVLSRLHWKKGIDTAIRALAELPDAHLCLAGEGPARREYERLAAALRLGERVHFLGWRADRKALLAACDICLLPSRYEPFGTVIAEAWSMRRPLIASLADGAQQYVRDNENGAVFAIDDATALAGRIRQIAADPAFAARLVEAGERDYRAQFSREVATAALLAVYRKAVAGGRRI